MNQRLAEITQAALFLPRKTFCVIESIQRISKMIVNEILCELGVIIL